MDLKIKDKKIILLSNKIISEYNICNYCLGRLFHKTDPNLSNYEIGKYLRAESKSSDIKLKNCWLCEGLIDEIESFADLIMNKLGEYEYDSFLVGTKVDDDILSKEKELIKLLNIDFSESIKTELNREIGKILEKKLKIDVDFKNPAIMAIIDTSYDEVSLQISSLYIYGRYKKLKRGIPQTKWFCKICNGKGCKRCNYSGKLYNLSIEELISKIFLKETKANDESFHGCGREDIDVKMLGNGRPFVLEIKNPKKRNINLEKIKNEINIQNKGIVEVNDLCFTNKEKVIQIKASKPNKIYKATIKCDELIKYEKLKKACLSLQAQKIGQFTPSRVAHRRAEMIRERHIYQCNIESVEEDIAIILIEAESGTYIKELISGDNGRTKPNLSEMMKTPCRVIKLDVIEIKGE